jgi:hypothetical protein
MIGYLQEEPLTDEQIDYMVDVFVKPAIRDAIRTNEKLTNAWQAFFTAMNQHIHHEFFPRAVQAV